MEMEEIFRPSKAQGAMCVMPVGIVVLAHANTKESVLL